MTEHSNKHAAVEAVDALARLSAESLEKVPAVTKDEAEQILSRCLDVLERGSTSTAVPRIDPRMHYR